MIFYFSGTGNSLHAAKVLASRLETGLVSMPDAVRAGQSQYNLAEGEPLGFVFPVYAWDVPLLVTDFVRNMQFETKGTPHVFAVFTCGANTGNTCKKFRRTLDEKGLALDAAYDLVMPDNYIIMLKTPPAEKRRVMLEKADARLGAVGDSVLRREKRVSIEAKNPPALFSTLLNWGFNQFALGTKKFRATERCTRCGLCADICPLGVIALEPQGVAWKAEKCAKCLACINRCPAEAIEYGSGTRGKERYVHPLLCRDE